MPSRSARHLWISEAVFVVLVAAADRLASASLKLAGEKPTDAIRLTAIKNGQTHQASSAAVRAPRRQSWHPPDGNQNAKRSTNAPSEAAMAPSVPERAYDIANQTFMISPQTPSPAATKNATATEIDEGVRAAKTGLRTPRA